jgi:hypothetical protein
VSIRSGRRRPTPRRGLATVAMAAVVVLALSSCDSQIHPGAAAVVDGTRIEQDQVDDTATSLCNWILALPASQRSAAPTFADLRSSLTDFHIQLLAADSVAEDEGLTIYPADVQKLAAQFTLPDDLSDSDTEILTTYLDDVARLYLTMATINAHADDSGVTDSSDQTVSPSSPPPVPDAVTKRLKSGDITVNPMYGVWDGATVTAGSGSLSALASSQPSAPNDEFPAEDLPNDQPPSQVCSA